MSTPHATRAHSRPVRPRAWLRLRRHHSAATTTAYTLLLGDRTVTTEHVDARVLASAGYRVGIPMAPELRRAASLVGASTDPGSVEKPAMYVADGPTESSTWRRVDDLTVEAYDDEMPTLRFTSRTGQPLSSELRHTVEQTDLVLVITETNASRPRCTSAIGTWRTVVLLPATR